MGSQDAPRKRRIEKGPWTGTIFDTENERVTKSVTLTKWKKAQNNIIELRNLTKENHGVEIDYKLFERIRGFLCHLAMTYRILFPYLKGFHLTLSAHLPQRNEEGWKLTDLQWIAYVEDKCSRHQISPSEKQKLLEHMIPPNNSPPKSVQPVPIFFSCVDALELFFSSPDPPEVHVISSNVFLAVYGFLDASGTGFGSILEKEGKATFQMGVRGEDDKDESSNWKEFQNVVETLEEEGALGNLNGSLLILAVDNSTVERCIYKGNSSSPKLYDLIVIFKHLELTTGARFIVSHVAGERIKCQGTDGISRGCLYEGISMKGSMLSFCPWHFNAFERNQHLKPWIESWAGNDAEFLTPKLWYSRGHDLTDGAIDKYGYYVPKVKTGTFIWSPPLVAAHACLEEVRKARLKRQNSTHIILTPKLMTPMWLKQFYKTVDILIPIKPHFNFWSHLEFEPLFVGICFPFATCYPWQIPQDSKIVQLG